MKLMRNLLVVAVVLGGFLFLGHGWQAAAMRREELKTQLAHERLIRIVESTLDVFSQHKAPDQDYYAELEDVWWLCYSRMHKSPLGQNLVNCDFEPNLAPYIEVIQDFPDDWAKRTKYINNLMANRTVNVTVIGFESGDEFLIPSRDGKRAENLDHSRQYDPVVVMKFVIHTSIEDYPGLKGEKVQLLRYSRPEYDFLRK